MIICFTRKFLSNHWKAYTVIKYQKFPSKDKDEVGKHIYNVISSWERKLIKCYVINNRTVDFYIVISTQR
jgi:hypothetical protein